MSETSKLDAAEFFLTKMIESVRNYEHFCHYFGAFLSASRSVMQHIEKKSKNNGKISWYRAKMNNSNILRFFKSTRDLDVHVLPCRLSKNVTVKVPALSVILSLQPIAVSSSGGIVYGTPIQVDHGNQGKVESVDIYKFDETWYDQPTNLRYYSEDDKNLCKSICRQYEVLVFCRIYIAELKTIIQEGM